MSEAKFVQPTTWNLVGGGIQVRYSTGGPNLHYQDSHQTRDYGGNQIRVVDVPDLGTLVSVTLSLQIDTGSTTFTVLLPPVNLPPPPALPVFVPVATDAVTTIHHLSPSPIEGFQHGQQNSYSVTTLSGEAA
jgi:hypothetical protein